MRKHELRIEANKAYKLINKHNQYFEAVVLKRWYSMLRIKFFFLGKLNREVFQLDFMVVQIFGIFYFYTF